MIEILCTYHFCFIFRLLFYLYYLTICLSILILIELVLCQHFLHRFVWFLLMRAIYHSILCIYHICDPISNLNTKAQSTFYVDKTILKHISQENVAYLWLWNKLYGWLINPGNENRDPLVTKPVRIIIPRVIIYIIL